MHMKMRVRPHIPVGLTPGATQAGDTIPRPPHFTDTNGSPQTVTVRAKAHLKNPGIP